MINFEPIKSSEARGDSKALTYRELSELAVRGSELAAKQSAESSGRASTVRLTMAARAATRVPWGGLTVDLNDGSTINGVTNRLYAVAARVPGQVQISIPMDAGIIDFRRAIDSVRDYSRNTARYLGIFRDEDKGMIDIDPVYITDNLDDAIAVGVYSHATGGIYDFATGNAVWVPHLTESETAWLTSDGLDWLRELRNSAA